jgi:hypothetical protein
MKYRQKTKTIDAIQWTGHNYNEILYNFPDHIAPMIDDKSNKVVLRTQTGTVLVLIGDYIIRNNDGSLKVFLPDEFEANYEAVG